MDGPSQAREAPYQLLYPSVSLTRSVQFVTTIGGQELRRSRPHGAQVFGVSRSQSRQIWRIVTNGHRDSEQSSHFGYTYGGRLASEYARNMGGVSLALVQGRREQAAASTPAAVAATPGFDASRGRRADDGVLVLRRCRTCPGPVQGL